MSNMIFNMKSKFNFVIHATNGQIGWLQMKLLLE